MAKQRNPSSTFQTKVKVLFSRLNLFFSGLFTKIINALIKFITLIKKGFTSIKTKIIVWDRTNKEKIAKKKKANHKWYQAMKLKYSPSIKEKLKFFVDLFFIIVLYGPMVNFMFTFFFKFEFSLGSVVAFGLLTYFVKYELTAIIIKIRGPKSPPFVVP